LEVFHATSPALSLFDPAQPWNSVIKSSVGKEAFEFWDEELKEPCRSAMIKGGPAWVARGASPNPEVWKAHLKDKGKGKGKGKEKGAKGANKKGNGKFSSSESGQPLCFDFNNGKCFKKCPNNRAHICQICLGPHRASECPKAPAGGVADAVWDDYMTE
jgi:hypothetical protein